MPAPRASAVSHSVASLKSARPVRMLRLVGHVSCAGPASSRRPERAVRERRTRPPSDTRASDMAFAVRRHAVALLNTRGAPALFIVARPSRRLARARRAEDIVSAHFVRQASHPVRRRPPARQHRVSPAIAPFRHCVMRVSPLYAPVILFLWLCQSDVTVSQSVPRQAVLLRRPVCQKTRIKS